ncbi:MAG: hypothetical protein ACR2MU_02540 [Gaiellaceae bacterium]
MAAIPEFDPRIIERFAEQLSQRAESVRTGLAIVGGIVGVGFGTVPLTPLGASGPIPSTFGFATILVGGLAGVLIGYVVGEGRAFRYRVQAQMALFQLQIERNTTARLTAAIAELPTSAPRSAPPPAVSPPTPPAVAPAASSPPPVAAVAPVPPPVVAAAPPPVLRAPVSAPEPRLVVPAPRVEADYAPPPLSAR